MAGIAIRYGVHQITAAPDLGLCLRRQASYGGIEVAYEGLGRWPGRKKLRYEHTPLRIGGIMHGVAIAVVFQKWRWTRIDVTLGLIFIASHSKEWPMTFITVRCPHCQSDQIVKRGKTARGTQRYLCQNVLCATGSFLLDYRN